MSIEHKEEQNGDRNRVEEERNKFGDSVSDEAMRELLDKQHGSVENEDERNVLSADNNARDVTGNELSAIFGSGASQINFEPVKSSTPIREDPSKRSASMGDEGDDSQKENLAGLDHLKRLRLDSSAVDSDEEMNLDLQAPLVPVDPSYVLTIHDAGSGGGFGDNEDLNTGGGYEKIVSGVGDTGVNDVGGQGELGDNGGENGMGHEEVDLKIVDKGGGHEKGEHSDGDSSE